MPIVHRLETIVALLRKHPDLAALAAKLAGLLVEAAAPRSAQGPEVATGGMIDAAAALDGAAGGAAVPLTAHFAALARWSAGVAGSSGAGAAACEAAALLPHGASDASARARRRAAVQEP